MSGLANPVRRAKDSKGGVRDSMTPVDARALIGQHGLRCTRQREVILEALRRCTSHPTAESLHRLVSSECPGTSLATVYNTLEAFCRAGLCVRLNGVSGGARYDATLDDHIHLVTDDGEIMDVAPDLAREILDSVPDAALRRIERRLGVRIGGVSIQLLGDRHPV